MSGSCPTAANRSVSICACCTPSMSGATSLPSEWPGYHAKFMSPGPISTNMTYLSNEQCCCVFRKGWKFAALVFSTSPSAPWQSEMAVPLLTPAAINRLAERRRPHTSPTTATFFEQSTLTIVPTHGSIESSCAAVVCGCPEPSDIEVSGGRFTGSSSLTCLSS